MTTSTRYFREGDKVMMKTGNHTTPNKWYVITRYYTKDNNTFISLINDIGIEESYFTYRVKEVDEPNIYNYSNMERAVVRKIKQLDRKFEQRKQA